MNTDSKLKAKYFLLGYVSGWIMTMIILFIMFLFMTSCSKDGCWKCQVITHYTHPRPAGPVEIIGVYEFCDKTDEEIRQFAITNAYTDTAFVQTVKCTTK